MNTVLKTRHPSIINSKATSTHSPAFTFNVVCERCHRTIYFSGEEEGEGETFPVLCDECANTSK